MGTLKPYQPILIDGEVIELSFGTPGMKPVTHVFVNPTRELPRQ